MVVSHTIEGQRVPACTSEFITLDEAKKRWPRRKFNLKSQIAPVSIGNLEAAARDLDEIIAILYPPIDFVGQRFLGVR